MNAIGLIFSNIHDYVIPELSRRRAIASIPFGGRYRMIDFELSNMVNSDITKVGVITNYNYQSLMDHIGTGKDWDLARRSGGIKILPPFITAYDSAKGEAFNTSRLELLKGALSFIERSKEEYVVMTDCDRVCTLDYQKLRVGSSDCFNNPQSMMRDAIHPYCGQGNLGCTLSKARENLRE